MNLPRRPDPTLLGGVGGAPLRRPGVGESNPSGSSGNKDRAAAAFSGRQSDQVFHPGLDHRHEIIAAWPAEHLMEGRALSVGRLLEPLAEAPHETHCLHVTTPLKGEVVFGIIEWDLAWMAAVAEAVNGGPLNPRWVSRRAELILEEGRRRRDDERVGQVAQLFQVPRRLLDGPIPPWWRRLLARLCR